MPKKDPRLEGRPSTVNEALVDDAVRRAALLSRLSTGEAGFVVRFLDSKVLPAVLSRIESRLGRLGAKASTRDRRLVELGQAVGQVIRAGVGEVSQASRARILAVGADEAEWMRGSIRRSMPFEVDLRAPSPKALRAALESTGPRGRPLGRSWRSWWDGLSADAHNRTMQQVRLGVASGDSVQDVARRVKGTVAQLGRDGSWATTRRQAEAVVRTAVAHVTSVARSEVAAENEDVVKGERWVCTLDARTTDICASLDGRVFKVGEGLRPPAHAQCRSIVVPVTKSFREMGIDLDDPPPPTRAAKNYESLAKAVRGEVPSDVTYGQWLRRQPTAVQNAVLGKGRAALFRAGRVPIEKFTDARNRPLNLAQLRKLDEKLRKPSTASAPQAVVGTQPGSKVGLPLGWVVEQRKTDKGREYKAYVAPDGTTYQSLKKAKVAAGDAKPAPAPPKPAPVTPPSPAPAPSSNGLPPDWSVEERKTPSGRTYKVFLSPSGDKYRSLKKAREAADLQKTPPPVKPTSKPSRSGLPSGLGDGWVVDLRTTTKGREYKVYVSPDGRRFQSLKSAKEHAATSGAAAPAASETASKPTKFKTVDEILNDMQAFAKDSKDADLVAQLKAVTSELEAVKKAYWDSPSPTTPEATDAENQKFWRAKAKLEAKQRELAQQREAAMDVMRKEFLRVVQGLKPGEAPKRLSELDVSYPTPSFKPKVSKTVEAGLDFVLGIVPPERVKGLEKLEVVSSTRAYMNARVQGAPARMGVSPKSDVGTVVHELGHRFDHASKKTLHDAEQARNDRVSSSGKASVSMAQFGMPYEIGNEDSFLAAARLAEPFSDYAAQRKATYAGKTYVYGATEYVSVGIEIMYADPFGFARVDRRWARDVLKILRGE